MLSFHVIHTYASNVCECAKNQQWNEQNVVNAKALHRATAHTHRIICTCLYNEIRNGFPYRPQKISRKCSFAVSMRTSIQTISSDRMPWYGSSWSIDDLQKHRARESVRKREKKWISFKPPEILIWASKRAAATTSTAKAFPIWRLCWVCARTEQIPSIWWKMLCLGIEWKIRIIFFNTTINHFVCVCVGINYTASILFPFVGLIFWQEFKPNFSHSFIFSLFGFHPFFSPHLLWLSNFHIMRPTEQNNDLSKYIWMNFECGTIAISQHLLYITTFMSLVEKTVVRYPFHRETFRMPNSQTIFNLFNGHFLRKYRLKSPSSIRTSFEEKFDFHFQ